MIKATQTGFYDLNVNDSCFLNRELNNTLESLFGLGYRTVAINQVVKADALPENKKKKKKGEPRDPVDCVPSPFNLQTVRNAATELGLANLTFFNRLTIVFSNPESIQKYLKSSNFKKYDIFGVIPTTLQALTFVSSNLDADIISFDPLYKMNIRLNRKMYNKLIDRNYHFELPYSAAIEDSTKRKNLIHLSHLYHTYGKSKNVIFSSGTENYMLLRSPYDIISLGFLFGLNELQSKNAVLYCPRKITVNALGRRHGKAVMFVENIEDTAEAEQVPVPNYEPEVIDLSESEDESMDTDEPAQKKSKHSINTT